MKAKRSKQTKQKTFETLLHDHGANVEVWLRAVRDECKTINARISIARSVPFAIALLRAAKREYKDGNREVASGLILMAVSSAVSSAAYNFKNPDRGIAGVEGYFEEDTTAARSN